MKSQRRFRWHLVLVCLLPAVLSAALPERAVPRRTAARLYEKDAHYYLKFLMALRSCHFTWNEAHLIASGDWAADLNHTTVAGAASGNNVQFHAFGSDELYREAKDVLWAQMHTHSELAGYHARQAALDKGATRAAAEQAKKDAHLEVFLVRFGVYLHLVEDRLAHAGYPTAQGHGIDTFNGNDPDSFKDATGRKPSGSSVKMVEASLTEMQRIGQQLGRRGDKVADVMNDKDFDALIKDLMAASDPAWRKGRTDGSLTPAGVDIMAKLKKRMDDYLKLFIASLDEKTRKQKQLPPEATDRGKTPTIPEPIPIELNKDGDPTQIGPRSYAVFGTAPKRRKASDAVVSELAIVPTAPDRADVRLTINNRGTEPTPPGTVRATVINVGTDSVIAEAETPVTSITPGGEARAILPVTLAGTRAADATVAVYADVADGDARNNTARTQLSGRSDPRTPERAAPQVDQPTGSIETFSGASRIFFVGAVSPDDTVLTTVRGPKPDSLEGITLEGIVEDSRDTVRAKTDRRGRAVLDIARVAARVGVPTLLVIRALDRHGKEVARDTSRIDPGILRRQALTPDPVVTQWPTSIRRGDVFTVRGENLGPQAQAKLGNAPQEILSASRSEAVGFAGADLPTGARGMTVGNERGDARSVPTNVHAFDFQAPRTTIRPGETLPLEFRYAALPESTRVDFSNVTPGVIDLRPTTQGLIARGQTYSTTASGDGAIGLLVQGKVASPRFAVNVTLTLPDPDSRSFDFTNDTREQGVNDLHVEFSEPVRLTDGGPFGKPPKARAAGFDLVAADPNEVGEGKTAKIVAATKSIDKVWVKRSWWTRGGAFVGCMTLRFKNPLDKAETFTLGFKQPVRIEGYEPGENADRKPVSRSQGRNNEETLSGLGGLPKGGEVMMKVCYPEGVKGERQPPELRGEPRWGK